MPMPSQTSSNPILLSFKRVFISSIFLSAGGIMLKYSAPAITDFAAYEVPSIYNGVVSWLRPPYLYLVINCIIISIVASSKLQSRKDDVQPLDGMVHAQPPPPVTVKSAVQADEYQYNDVSGGYDVKVVENGTGFVDAYENLVAVVNNATTPATSGIVVEDEPTCNKENECVTTKSTWNAPQSKDTKENSVENLKSAASAIPSVENLKSAASARFGNRRNLKASAEGSKAVLGVSKPKKQDTLESTWKTITEGRAMPLKRHLRKNETWDKTNPPPKVIMAKTETLNDRTNGRSPLMTPSPGSGKLRKEPSLSQDELNRRVEAFIKKFNEDMRLQRQESLNQYVQKMVG